MKMQTGTSQFSLRALAIALAASLVAILSAVAPAQAASDNSNPFTFDYKIISGDQFEAGDTVKVKFTATNASTDTITFPGSAGLLLITAADYDGEFDATGNFKTGAFRDDNRYFYWEGLLALPTSMKPKQSISSTVTYVTTPLDVRNGGIFFQLAYVKNESDWFEGKYRPLTLTIPTKGGTDPQVLGTAKVGKTLSAKPGYSGRWDTSYSYQWLRSGNAIKGATKGKYTLKAADAGKKISVKITFYDRSGGWISGTFGLEKKVAALTLTATAPKIKGTAKVGKTLKVEAKNWTKGTKKTYQWYANGKKLKGATKTSLKLTSAHAGKKITVKVTGTKAGYTKVVKTSKKTATVKRR